MYRVLVSFRPRIQAPRGIRIMSYIDGVAISGCARGPLFLVCRGGQPPTGLYGGTYPPERIPYVFRTTAARGADAPDFHDSPGTAADPSKSVRRVTREVGAPQGGLTVDSRNMRDAVSFFVFPTSWAFGVGWC